MLVAQIVVEDNRRTIEWLPLYVLLYRESTIAKNVIVCVITVAIIGIIINRVHKNSLQFLFIKSETATNDCTGREVISSVCPYFQDIL